MKTRAKTIKGKIRVICKSYTGKYAFINIMNNMHRDSNEFTRILYRFEHLSVAQKEQALKAFDWYSYKDKDIQNYFFRVDDYGKVIIYTFKSAVQFLYTVAIPARLNSFIAGIPG